MKRIALAAALAPLLLFSAPASAATLSVDGGWSSFSFGATGSAWSDAFDFVLSSPAYLKVTDAFIAGDQFSIKINGSPFSILTSIPTGNSSNSTSDYDTAASSPLWSSISILLDVGSYTVTGAAYKSPYESGGGAIQVASITAVPGPEAGAGLSALAILGVAYWAKRRRDVKAIGV